jgi:hypothetical protein
MPACLPIISWLREISLLRAISQLSAISQLRIISCTRVISQLRAISWLREIYGLRAIAISRVREICLHLQLKSQLYTSSGMLANVQYGLCIHMYICNSMHIAKNQYEGALCFCTFWIPKMYVLKQSFVVCLIYSTKVARYSSGILHNNRGVLQFIPCNAMISFRVGVKSTDWE